MKLIDLFIYSLYTKLFGILIFVLLWITIMYFDYVSYGSEVFIIPGLFLLLDGMLHISLWCDNRNTEHCGKKNKENAEYNKRVGRKIYSAICCFKIYISFSIVFYALLFYLYITFI